MWFGLDKFLDKRRAQTAIAEATWQAVESRLPFLGHLPKRDRQDLRALALQFLDRKVFCGARDFEPDTPVRLSIALQACLPILKLGLGSYDGWTGIIVYPGDFVVPRRIVDNDGLLHEYDEEALGESWEGGPVVLSWFDNPDDYAGANVVIHEFAHKLDMLNGEADGLPPLHAGMSEDDWLDAFEAGYEDFCDRINYDEETDIDPYAAEHPAEFFAVLSEVFFTQPGLLTQRYPAIYGQMRLFYRQDPQKRDGVPSARS